MSHKFYRIISCLGFALLSVNSLAQTPVWKPDTKFSHLLGPTVTINQFQVRPPKGYELVKTIRGSESVFAWCAEPLQAGKPLTGFSVTTMALSKKDQMAMDKAPLDVLAFIYVRNYTKGWSDVQISQTESGKIQKTAFVRLVWSAKSPTGVPMQGFCYAAVCHHLPVIMTASEKQAKQGGAVFRVCDQAILSFSAL